MKSPWTSKNNESNERRSKNRIFLKLEESMLCCEAALKTNPTNIQALYNLGKCYVEIRDYLGTRHIIDKLRNLDKRSIYAYILEGHLFMKKSFLVESYKSFLKAYTDITYNDTFLCYGIGLLFENIEDYRLARKWYTHLIKSDIELFKYLEVLYRIGVCYKKENRPYDAIEVFNTLKGVTRSELFTFDINLQLAHLFERVNNIKNCLSVLEGLKNMKKMDIFINRLYSWIYYKQNKHNKLKELENDPDYRDPYIIYLVGRVYAGESKYNEALDLFKTSIAMDKNMYLAYNSIGVLHYKLEKYNLAISNFQAAANIKPYFTEALENIKLVEKKLNNYNLKERTMVLDVYPDLVRTRYLDSQAVFNETIYYINESDLSIIQELSTLKMERLY